MKMSKQDAVEVGRTVGRAIARDTLADGFPREWTGLDPQDADRFTEAGLVVGSEEWDAANEAAKSAYMDAVNGKLAEAIERSTKYNEIVDVEVASVSQAVEWLTDFWDGELDYRHGAMTTEDDLAITDVWGWTDETPEGDQEWRLYLYSPRV